MDRTYAQVVAGITLSMLVGGYVAGYFHAKKTIEPIVINHVQFVEKKVYVKTKTNRDTTVTKPDGTTIVTHSTTTSEGSTQSWAHSTTDVQRSVQPTLKLGAAVLRSTEHYGLAINTGFKTYDNTWIVGSIGYLNEPFIGLGLEVQR